MTNSTAARATYGDMVWWDTGAVTDMSYIFCGYGNDIPFIYPCTAGKFLWRGLFLSHWDTSQVTEMIGTVDIVTK